jgi:hypothetical protein
MNLLQDISEVNIFVMILGLAIISIFLVIDIKPDGRIAKWMRRMEWIE